MCSTVHGSYQLSTESPKPALRTAGCPAQPQPQPHTCMQARWHHLTLLCPLGIQSWLIPVPPTKSKEKRTVINIHTPKSYTQFWAK